MAHIVASRVQETSISTGVGNIALGGAATGMRAFSAVMANNDTTYYLIRNQANGEWEEGFGTWQTGNTLVRTTPLNGSAATPVNFTSGTKDVFITSPAIVQSWGVLNPASITADQNDYNPTGLGTANVLALTNDNVRYITGLAGGYPGRRITLHVLESAQGPIILRDESASSTAANRFNLPARRVFLWPGDTIDLFYDPVTSRWDTVGHTASMVTGDDLLDEFDEFYSGVSASGAATEAGENIGRLEWRQTANGTAASTSPQGVAGHPGIIRLVTGATSGNDTRLHLGNAATDDIFRAQDIQYMATLVRPIDITSNRIKFGLGVDLGDGAVGSWGTDGVFFEFDTATNANWRVITRAASTNTLNTSGIALANNDWDQLEAFRLTNGNWSFWINETLIATHSTNLPTTTMVNMGWFVETQTTALRSLEIDWVRFRTARLGQRFT